VLDEFFPALALTCVGTDTFQGMDRSGKSSEAIITVTMSTCSKKKACADVAPPLTTAPSGCDACALEWAHLLSKVDKDVKGRAIECPPLKRVLLSVLVCSLLAAVFIRTDQQDVFHRTWNIVFLCPSG